MSKPKKSKTEITGEFSWWLSKKRPFIINDEYKLELEFVDLNHMSARIKITKLKKEEQDNGQDS